MKGGGMGWGKRRPLAVAAWGAALLWSGCARLDGGAGPPAVEEGPRVAAVSPAPGPVDGASRFRVEFPGPMDPSLLLADVAHSETVALARAGDVEGALAALARAHPTDRERELFAPAKASVASGASALELQPDDPLAPGDWVLLVSGRVKDAAGRALGTPARFAYRVEAQPPGPFLASPLAGSEAPANLARVRVEFPLGMPGQVLTLEGPQGPMAAAMAPEAAGAVVLSLCPGAAACERLAPGSLARLRLDGREVPGASFRVADCFRDEPPALLAAPVVVRDTWAAASVSLDWPATLRLELAPEEAGRPLDAEAFDRLCSRGACRAAEALVQCAPAACGEEVPAACNAAVRVDGLEPGTRLAARLRVEDDEGHLAVLALPSFTTLSRLPAARLTEVMASPGGAEPRGDGEYVELLNPGPGALDVEALSLSGADGVLHPLLGAPLPSPLLLQPGQRALAVGSAFDPSRYALPPGTPLLRASTRRLLSHGLADDPVPSLVLAVAPGGRAVELDRYPGGGRCSAGQSLQRAEGGPGDPQAAPWRCASGTPGR